MRFGSEAAEGVIQEADLLEDNEDIIWARTPDKDAYSFLTKVYAFSVFFFFWLMLSMGNLFATTMNGHLTWQGISIVISLAFTGLTVYLRISDNRKEAYALTNQRVIHYYHSALGYTQNVDDLYHEQVVDVDMSKSGVTAKLYDVGHVLFSRRGSQSATSGGGAGSAVAFKNVNDPKNTHRSLRRTIIKEVGGGALKMKDVDSYMEGRSLSESKERGAASAPDMSQVNEQLEEIKDILKSIDRKL